MVMAGTSYQPLSQGEDVEGSYQEVPRTDLAPTIDDILVVRPPVYYNDGPFSPPSSVDESQEHLLGKDRDVFSSAERGHQDHQEDKHSHSRLGRVSDFDNKVVVKCFSLC
jgi:hypothetical protein